MVCLRKRDGVDDWRGQKHSRQIKKDKFATKRQNQHDKKLGFFGL